MSWIYLLFAIITEVIGTASMKLSDGLTKTAPSVAIFVFYGISFVLMAFALKKIDVSIAYAIWSGLGTALIAAIGLIWFKEPITVVKMVSLGFIVIGAAGLNLGGETH